ncbi:hypothetical protein V5O48_010585 [Marasmius crinis-equi]|uniref:Uncharacterized protein n=1 Tax=Marasmius crinis-equi TaxID=585013 RepID=A0ABR3F7Z1_9AGAR
MLKPKGDCARTTRYREPNQGIRSIHGHSSAVADSVVNYPSTLDSKFIAVTKELKDEFPFNRDMTDGEELGVGYQLSQLTMAYMHEISATAYLHPSFVKEHNIDVVPNTLATRILPDVDCQQVHSSTIVAAQKQIIPSTGAIRTPQLLMLSGTGPKSHLDGTGIKTTNCPPPISIVLSGWNETRSGRLKISKTNTRGSLRATAKEHTRRCSTCRIVSGKKASHYELMFLRNLDANTQSTVNVKISDMNSQPYGEIRLKLVKRYASPSTNPRMMSVETDACILKAGYRAARRSLNATVINDFLLGPANDATYPDSEEDNAILEFIESRVSSLRHPCGSAVMSRKNDRKGAVIPDLKLERADGTRIVDASISVSRLSLLLSSMEANRVLNKPFIPGTHLQSPIYIVAERGVNVVN